jgi:2-oxoglutarate dehydrogenase E1 component
MPLLIRGDAAFAGQGVIAECLGLSGLKGHRTGGSVHFVINNQIGFTTSPLLSRSSPYPTDVAKMIEAPVFHVNGDDPEAVVYVCKVATECRQRFGRPVVTDMFCYRRYGHNEGDEPSFTQPLMYAAIHKHRTTLELYFECLIAESLLTAEDIDKIKADWRAHLETEFEGGQDYRPNNSDWLDGQWKDLKAADVDGPPRGNSGVAIDQLAAIGARLRAVPEGFNVHIRRATHCPLRIAESWRRRAQRNARSCGLPPALRAV